MDPKPPEEFHLQQQALQQRLERLSAALAQAPLAPRPMPASGPTTRSAADQARSMGRGGLALAVALLAVGVATGSPALWVLASVLGVLSGVLLMGGVGEALLSSLPAGLAPKDPTRPHIGLGASIAQDAIIEPGATVEMGADVGPGAVVKRGAVVRMGATVRGGAILEEGVVVGWGADVLRGAVVGREAVVGAGATVHAEATVPPGTRLLPGATWAKGTGTRAAPTGAAPTGAGPASAPAAADPREARIHAACERITAELRQAPAQVRAALGANEQAVHALRETCLGLLDRERLLRAECSPQSLAFLDRERAELERRIATSTDAPVRRSLEQAVAAIDDQRRQRALLRLSAERLDAELTRLVWTLDGMGAQLVRLRSAGLEAARAPDAGVLQSMQQLHEEIDAIAEALEHVAQGDVAQDDAAEAPSAPSPGRQAEPTVQDDTRVPGARPRERA